ncbi:MAG: riboflavin biosynthesis protein RibF [Clostridia bacterium]|nr:riboflavin biosynthesis protein RibF [Clostridia bacterium]
MLKTVWLTEKKNIDLGTVMLLGGFDGLHVGHRALVSRAKQCGLPIGIMTIVGGKEKSLFTFAEREEIFRQAGVNFVLELPFSEIKDLSPEQFLQLLQQEFSPKLFVCGEDFRFGKNAEGTPEKIKQATQVCVEVQPLLEVEGEKVSARSIKTLLQEGELSKANALLSHSFFLKGEVIKDRQIGRTMGFPTANIVYPNEKFPLKKGVYETRVTVNGQTYKGITNYGARPTFDDETVLTETHLDGFDGNLYGETLQVEFLGFLRDIRRFESAKQLKEQLTKDIQAVRNND